MLDRKVFENFVYDVNKTTPLTESWLYEVTFHYQLGNIQHVGEFHQMIFYVLFQQFQYPLIYLEQVITGSELVCAAIIPQRR
jgi:hypothetical protein